MFWVDGNAGTEGAPGKRVGGWVETNGETLSHGLGTPFCWEILVEIGISSCLSDGGPNTQLNIVAGGGWQLSMGLSISKPSNMSHFIIFMNSPMAWHSSLTLSAKGRASGLASR